MMTGLNRIILLNKVTFLLSISNTVLIIIFVGILQWGIGGFMVAWVTNSVCGAVVALLLTLPMDRLSGLPARRAFKDLVGFGLRVHGASIAYQLFLRFDSYTVKIILGSTALGYYSLSTSLAERLWVLPNALGPSSLSKISQLPRKESALLTAKVTRTSLLMMLSAAIPFAIIAGWLVPFLYGAEYAASVLPLTILLLGTLGFAGMAVLNNYVLGQMQRPGLLSIISWLELGISIPLYLVFIYWLGIVGAAIASTVTYLLAMAGTTVVFIRDSGLSVWQVLVPRPEDFRDYVRVVTSMLRRSPT
jgi:O-antigen/teichoic acid export membrane protein